MFDEENIKQHLKALQKPYRCFNERFGDDFESSEEVNVGSMFFHQALNAESTVIVKNLFRRILTKIAQTFAKLVTYKS